MKIKDDDIYLFIATEMSLTQGPDDASDEYSARCRSCHDGVSSCLLGRVIAWMRSHAERHLIAQDTNIRRVFYDFEFYEDGRTIMPISLGMVDNFGDELYVVFQNAPWVMIQETHPWLVENVIPFLPRNLYLADIINSTNPFKINYDDPKVLGLTDIKNKVSDFLHGTHKKDGKVVDELWAYYAAYDHVALAQLWGPMIDMPKDIPWYTNDLMTLWNQANKPPKPSSVGHHALADARWNQELFLRCNKVVMA